MLIHMCMYICIYICIYVGTCVYKCMNLFRSYFCVSFYILLSFQSCETKKICYFFSSCSLYMDIILHIASSFPLAILFFLSCHLIYILCVQCIPDELTLDYVLPNARLSIYIWWRDWSSFRIFSYVCF